MQIFLAYVVYHVISKIRGNEKNCKMNNYGIALAVLGLWVYTITSIDLGTLYPILYETEHWRNNHYSLYLWIYWSTDSAYYLYHWFFNWRYIKSTFRLPVLEKSAEFHNHMLDRILEQRDEQEVLFTSQELEDQSKEMMELKARQVRQENWSTGIEVTYFLLMIASSYPYVYFADQKISTYLLFPMFLLLNIAMLYSVATMRFAIKRMPNLLVNENLVVVHVLLFTAVNALWIADRVY